MRSRTLLAVAGWVAAAAAALGTGLAGAQVIGSGINAGSGGDVLTAEEAARELDAAGPPPPATPSSTGQPTVEPTDQPPSGSARASAAAPPATGPANVRSFSSAGGSVLAGCAPAGAVLVSWTPAQGYRVDRVVRGPGEHAEVRFDRAGGNSGKGNGEVRVTVRCAGGVPTAGVDQAAAR